MMFKNTIALVLFSLVSLCYHAQKASIVFKGMYEFQVTIDLIKQHNSYSNNIRVNNLKGNHPYNIKINFKNDSAFAQTNIYLIDDGLTHIYNVTKEKIDLKKVVPAASYPKDEQQLLISYIINTNLPVDTIVADTAITDTTYTIPFSSYYKLADYEGRLGCPFPIKDAEQAELRGIALSENLEESKLEKVIIAMEDMDSVCVLVDQIKEIIVLFEFEETRLYFAKYMLQYTFDIDNYEKLYRSFNFENSKEQLRKLLEN